MFYRKTIVRFFRFVLSKLLTINNLSDGGAIDDYIVECNSLRIMDFHRFVGGEGGICEGKAAERKFGEAVDVDSLSGAGTEDIGEVYVAHLGGRFIHRLNVRLAIGIHFGSRNAGIIEVENHPVADDILHVDMVAPYILYQAAATARALEAEPHIGTDKAAAAHLDILHASRHLAADDESAMSVIYGAVADDEIAAFSRITPSVCIFTGFDADGIIPHVEEGSGEDDVLACVNVDTVAICRIVRVADNNILDNHVLAIKRMKIPAWAVLEGAVLKENPFAVPEAYHDRAQEGLDFVLVERRVREVEASCSCTGLLVTFVGKPDLTVIRKDSAALKDGFPLVVGHLALLDLPPILSAAVDDSAAGYRYIRHPFRMDGRKAAAHIQTLEIRIDYRIKVLVGIEDYYRILADEEFNMALQADRAGTPHAGRDLKTSATVLSVTPSPTPPKSQRDTLREGIEGAWTFSMANGRSLYRPESESWPEHEQSTVHASPARKS